MADKKETAVVLYKRADLTNPTPMMQQYLDVKAEYPNHILMYRLGDFYEMFFEDAVTASRELELTLTGRDCGDNRRAAMCGVPFHKADLYMGQLVEKGFKVAVCEQTENPASKADALVRREVIRVVTPGTVTDAELLTGNRNNYLAAVYDTQDEIALSFADVSTGEVLVTHFSGEDLLERLQNELSLYGPKELILNVEQKALGEVADYMVTSYSTMLTDNRAALFDEKGGDSLLSCCFSPAETESFRTEGEKRAVLSLLRYIQETQMQEHFYVRSLTVYQNGQYMEIDSATRRNLELLETLRTKEKRGSLLWVLDKTETAMGGRLLRNFILKPLLSPGEIVRRQGAVRDLYDNFMVREELRRLLSQIFDFERLTAKAVYGTANAKELAAIGSSLAALPDVREQLRPLSSPRMTELRENMDDLRDLCTLLQSAIQDEPPLSVREGRMIRDGYHEEVDHLRSLADDGEKWVREIENQEREATGIKTLRVNYNKVFGYYIEVTKSLIDQVPPRYIRKQTLTNCERYITQELKDLEATLLGAADRLCALEYALFTEVREKVAAAASRLQSTAAKIAEIDVYLSLADVAVKNRYVCPEVDLSDRITVREGRHPVVERFVSDSYFVPNDTDLGAADHRLMLITGPNMAGKSTYMRQVALLTVMAQIGSFVPAAEAHIGIVDKVFTRVGASDDLASGQSTFMLEMTEVANILKNATSRSLIIYDEVGRGTSTFDGMSIARAVLEYTAGKKVGAKTLFATHYHELTVMEGEIPGVVNYHIAAKKRGDSITFLRKIVRGATDDSYGIEVAKLSGVPNEVIKRAREILGEIEGGTSPGAVSVRSKDRVREEPAEEDLFTALIHREEGEVADKIRALDLNTLTPIEAMNFIFQLKKMLEKTDI